MNPNYSISIMQSLKLVGLNTILKISCSLREELLPGFIGDTDVASILCSTLSRLHGELYGHLLLSETLAGKRESRSRRKDKN